VASIVVVIGGCLVAPLGALASGSAENTAVAMTWTGPPEINGGLAVHDVSCVSSLFCVAVGDWVSGEGDAMVFDGHSWTTPTSVLTTASTLSSVSCTSTSFCMAVDDAGEFLTFDGTSWTTPAFIAAEARDGQYEVSCASATMCVAIGNAYAYTYDGTTWTQVSSLDDPDDLTKVSCTETSVCVVAGSGLLATLDGGTWTTAADSADINAVSCAPTADCITISVGNDVQEFDGTTWTDEGTVDPASPLVAASCAVSFDCTAFDENGNVVTSDGATWSVGATVDQQDHGAASAILDVSCASSSFCVAIDQESYVFYDNGGTWTTNASTQVDENSGLYGLSISCASTTSCVGVDGVGDALTFDGTSWTPPASNKDPDPSWSQVSCASVTFCMAVDYWGDAFIYNGQTWTPTSSPAGSLFTDVSCPVVGSCMASGDHEAVIYTNGAWGQPATPIPTLSSNKFTAMACASLTLCAAADEEGDMFMFTGSKWNEQTGVFPLGPDGINYVTSMSCVASSTFCVGVDSYGDAITYQDGQWSVVPTGAQNHGFDEGLNHVSCASPTFCVAINSGGVTVVYNGTQWTQIAYLGSDISGIGSGVALSCPTTTFCVAVDDTGIVHYLYPDTTSVQGGPDVGSAAVAESVTFTATVNTNAPDLVSRPTGEVRFVAGSVALCQAAVDDGTATCAASDAPAGVDEVKAQYSGDINFMSSAATSQLLVGGAFAPPTASITVPADQAVYHVGQVVDASFTCTAGNGTTISSCTGSVPSGSAIVTTSAAIGSHSFTVVAKDADGQTAQAVATYSVVAVPVIKKLSPARGKVGQAVTIKGTALASATIVSFGSVTAEVTTDTASKIVVTVPPGAETGPVSVTTGGGTATSPNAFVVKTSKK
jgi:hypothetical protein